MTTLFKNKKKIIKMFKLDEEEGRIGGWLGR